jgi:hypothetical protein
LLKDPEMRRLLVLSLSAALLGGCGGLDASLVGVPTSPAGYDDEAPSALPLKVIEWGRQFRGNPIALGVLTGAALLVALGLGAYTLHLVHRDHRRGGP